MNRFRCNALLGLMIAVSGCVTDTQKCAAPNACDDCRRGDDFCVDAVPAKPGTYVNGWNEAMRCAARAPQLVVYRNSWFNGGTAPGPRASDDLQRFAELLQAGNDHLIVETEPVQPGYDETLQQATDRTRDLNDARYQYVVDSLAAAGVSNAAARVHLSPLEPVGTRGMEAPRVFQQLFFGGNQNGNGNGQGGQGGLGGLGGGQGGFGGGRGF